jgi:hypothetical protein
MKPRTLLVVAVLLTSTSAVLAKGLTAASPRSQTSDASRLVVMPAADLKWTDLDPTGAPGVKAVDLWGDHTKGAFGAFFKLPAGFAVPLHTHTYDIKVVIVSGTYVQAPEGKTEFRIGPGSYFLQPGGNYRHTTSCDPASDCVFYAESKGKFDLKVVDQGKKPAKK